jgi:type IV pilus biogenesis protein CpaD/CtpE
MNYNYVLSVLVIPSLLLAGCSVESKSWMNDDRVEVHNDQFTDTFETAKMDDQLLHAVSDYYYRYGNGPANIVVSYDSQSKINTKAQAEKSLWKIREILSRNGVNGIHAATSDAVGSGDISTTLVTFPALAAAAPQNCGLMAGYENPSADISNDPNENPKYRYGCTVESLLAKQVSRPSDLLGKQGFETYADGRRQERVISTQGYYDDKPNEPLDGEKATSN